MRKTCFYYLAVNVILAAHQKLFLILYDLPIYVLGYMIISRKVCKVKSVEKFIGNRPNKVGPIQSSK